MNYISFYLLVRHFIKKGAIKAPNAAPKLKTPIKNPLTVDCWDSDPKNSIMVEDEIIER